jgi:hypothetical protein
LLGVARQQTVAPSNVARGESLKPSDVDQRAETSVFGRNPHAPGRPADVDSLLDPSRSVSGAFEDREGISFGWSLLVDEPPQAAKRERHYGDRAKDE